MSTHEVVVPGGLRGADTARLCAGVAARLRAGGVTRVLCRVEHTPSDLGAVDALARLHLTARRGGARLSVHRPSDDLSGLLQLLGLGELLGPPDEADDAQDGAGPGSGGQAALHHVDEALPQPLDHGLVQ